MKTRLTRGLLVVLGAASILVVPQAARAHVDAAGQINCVLTGGVVFDPTDLAHASRLVGEFGAVGGLPSAVQCTGTISGTAAVSGGFTTCRQGDPGSPPAIPACTQSDPFLPQSDPLWNGVNTFNAQGLGPMTQVTGRGDLTPTAQGVNLRYTDDPLGGLVSCHFEFFGHAPVVELKITLTCQQGTGGASHSYVGAATATFVPLMSQAGNLVDGPHPLCPAPTVDPQCFRAVLFDGDIQASYPAPS